MNLTQDIINSLEAEAAQAHDYAGQALCIRASFTDDTYASLRAESDYPWSYDPSAAWVHTLPQEEAIALVTTWYLAALDESSESDND